MEVLVLGGTGAMGIPLVKLLSQRGDSVYVTTRSQKQNSKNITYICGNAKDPMFFKKLIIGSMMLLLILWFMERKNFNRDWRAY